MAALTARRRWPAILVLIVLAPVSAEVLIGDLPFTPTGLLSLIFFMPIYGAGAILIREVAVRRRSGLPGLFVLGMAYCLVEEGLALRSLTSPSIYHGIGLAMGGRIDGVNGVYLLLQLVNHPIWSIIVPVVITDLIFPAHRNRAYLRIPGMIITPLIFVIGVALTGFSARTTIDPGYLMPLSVAITLLIIIVILVVIAVGPLAHRHDAPASFDYRPAPSPWLILIISAVASWMLLAPLWLPGRFGWSFARGPAIIVMIIIAAAGVTCYLVLLRRWGALHAVGTVDGGTWSPQHRAAAVSGLLLGHSAFGAVIQRDTGVRDRVGLIILLLISCALLVPLIRSRGRSVDQSSAR